MDDILQLCLLFAGVGDEQETIINENAVALGGNSNKAKKWRDLLDN